MEEMGLERARRVKRSPEEWQAIVKRFEKGQGVSREEFCRREQIALSSFTRWRENLRERRRPPSGFVELPGRRVGEPCRVELELSSGVVLRVWG